MAESVETVSATEAAALLGLTRERLRQLVVARELPERVADSSRFRPRYVRAEMEAFGRATGRIKTASAPSSMRLAVDQLVLPAADSRTFGAAKPAHVRVWEREGWPPLVVIADLANAGAVSAIHALGPPHAPAAAAPALTAAGPNIRSPSSTP